MFKNIVSILSKINIFLNDPIIIILSDHGTRFKNETDEEKKFIFFAIKKNKTFCRDFAGTTNSIDMVKNIIKCL